MQQSPPFRLLPSFVATFIFTFLLFLAFSFGTSAAAAAVGGGVSIAGPAGVVAVAVAPGASACSGQVVVGGSAFLPPAGFLQALGGLE